MFEIKFATGDDIPAGLFPKTYSYIEEHCAKLMGEAVYGPVSGLTVRCSGHIISAKSDEDGECQLKYEIL